MALAAGHVAWGLVAHREPLRELLRAGMVDSVGDGIFRKAHAADARATAFWFLIAAPLMGLSGYLADAAERAGDGRTMAVGGLAVIGIGVSGAVVIPRSGFAVAPTVGGWLFWRGRAVSRGAR